LSADFWAPRRAALPPLALRLGVAAVGLGLAIKLLVAP
jgi:hypothetical protein